MPKPIALTKNRTVRYVLPSNRDDPEEDQVVFILRTLPYTVRMDIFNALVVDPEGGVRADVSRKFRLACKHGIAGWENFTDSEGEEIEWIASTQKKHGVEVITDDCLAFLPSDVLADLGNAIDDLSTSEADQVGK